MADNSYFLSPLTFLGSKRALARYVGRPLAQFFAVEAAGGIVLLAATAAALIWANVDIQSYEDFWTTHIVVEIGTFSIEEGHLDFRAFVNDGLMALFFFVVGLEIKRELVNGELRDPRKAALPAIAALGGMLVPAVIYLAFNLGGEGQDGWGIPMATDIAFAVGVVALLGPRVPSPLKIFLLTLAIVDDIGAILVIALFYTSDLSVGWLAIALIAIAFMYVMRRLKIWYFPAYWLVGVFAWLAFLESGVHATIAGVIMGLITPAKPLMEDFQAEEVVDTLERQTDISASEVREASFYIQESVPVAERLEVALHPITSYIIIPIFALANAGIIISSESIDLALSSAVTTGVFFGLVVGKTIGVGGAAWIANRLGIGRLPKGVRGIHMTGISIVSGIGFTVSLFITALAFDDRGLQEIAKMGVLAASVLAAIAGSAVLWFASRKHRGEPVGLEDVNGQPLEDPLATPSEPKPRPAG